MKLLMVVISSFALVCSGVENQKSDEAQYKTHRISTVNGTQTPVTSKTPVYEFAQVYTNLSNIKDYVTAKAGASRPPTMVTVEPLKTTDGPSDAVRVFITLPPGKKKKPQWRQQQRPLDTFAQSPTTVNPLPRTSSPSVFLVTAKNAVSMSLTDSSQKTPVYSPSDAYYHVPTAADDDNIAVKRRPVNGTKPIRRVLKSPKQTQPSPYANNTQPSMAAARNVTSQFRASNYSSVAVASKPFTTVLVPKQMLDSGDFVRSDYGDSFRPIAAPAFLYQQQAVDTNSVSDNRRASYAVAQPTAYAKVQTATSAPVLTKYGFAKPAAHVTDEQHVLKSDRNFAAPQVGGNAQHDRYEQQVRPAPYVEWEQPKSASNHQLNSDRNSVPQGGNTKRDGFDQQVRQAYTLESEQPVNVQHRYEVKAQESPKFNSPRNAAKPTESVVKSPPPLPSFSNNPEPSQKFYPATEMPAPKAFLPYSPKYNSRPSESVNVRPSYEVDYPSDSPKEYTNAPIWYTSKNPIEVVSSGAPEFNLSDANAKDVLKSLLRDMLKSKQPIEAIQSRPTASSASVDDILDSYFKSKKPTLDLMDNYDIETGESLLCIN